MQKGRFDSSGLNIYYVAKVLFPRCPRAGVDVDLETSRTIVGFSKEVTFGAVQSSETENGYKVHNFKRKEVEIVVGLCRRQLLQTLEFYEITEIRRLGVSLCA